MMTGSWGQWGNAFQHPRYIEAVHSRRKCHCGCGGRVTHAGMCNGVAMTDGCELSVRRWVRDPRPRPRDGYLTK